MRTIFGRSRHAEPLFGDTRVSKPLLLKRLLLLVLEEEKKYWRRRSQPRCSSPLALLGVVVVVASGMEKRRGEGPAVVAFDDDGQMEAAKVFARQRAH